MNMWSMNFSYIDIYYSGSEYLISLVIKIDYRKKSSLR
jgi:hypothetical protein